MENKKPKLTAKQSLFVKEYCANGFNATRAAMTAGYSKKTAFAIGTENLTKPLIKEHIDLYKKERSNKCDITFDWVLDQLKFAIAACKDGSASKNGEVHVNGLVSAIAELNKMTGFHAPEKKLVANANVPSRTERSKILAQFKAELSEFEKEY